MSPRQAYDRDKAYCGSAQSTQPKDVCLKEAARAYQEARAGKGESRSGAAGRTASHHKAGKAKTSTSGTSDASAEGSQ